MTDYVKANGNSASYSTFKFTNGKFYKVVEWMHPNCAEVKDDNGRVCLVGVGKPTLRLAGGGRFERVSELQSRALKIASDAENLAQREAIREAVKKAVGDTLKDGSLWRISKPGHIHIGETKIGSGFISSGIKPNEPSEAEKQLEAIKKALRCPDGFDVVKQAEVVRTLADALIKLQNSTNC